MFITARKLINSACYVSICNLSYVKLVNSDKITIFREYPSLTSSFEQNPYTQLHEILSLKS